MLTSLFKKDFKKKTGKRTLDFIKSESEAYLEEFRLKILSLIHKVYKLLIDEKNEKYQEIFFMYGVDPFIDNDVEIWQKNHKKYCNEIDTYGVKFSHNLNRLLVDLTDELEVKKSNLKKILFKKFLKCVLKYSVLLLFL